MTSTASAINTTIITPPLRSPRTRVAPRSTVRPISAITSSPNSRPISRTFRRMSPLRMWLNSCAMTPCSSARFSVVSAPRVTPIAAFDVLWPAAKALMPLSCSSR